MYPKKEKSTDKKSLKNRWFLRLHEIIFETDTPAGKWFDIILLWAIVISIVLVMLESVSSIDLKIGNYLRIAEWAFTIIFTIEYICRILSAGKAVPYVFSFYGIIDLLALLPNYLGVIIGGGARFLLVMRSFRLFRVFRIFKLTRFLKEGDVLMQALKASKYKIILFIGVVLSICIIMGTLMFVIEDGKNGFSSIPLSIYWAIITLTTVGYGDIYPMTSLGQTIASIIMLLGYGIIAVPTGIITAELATAARKELSCKQCGLAVHDSDASFCKGCGKKLLLK